jgi:hypothetical protein
MWKKIYGWTILRKSDFKTLTSMLLKFPHLAQTDGPMEVFSPILVCLTTEYNLNQKNKLNSMQ